jgi:hypothetical protein
MRNADTPHAFCVVDDLIFDSSTPYALKLTMDSVNWITRGEGEGIYQAYRFNMKYSPPNCKIDGEYKHVLKTNWDHSSMH